MRYWDIDYGKSPHTYGVHSAHAVRSLHKDFLNLDFRHLLVWDADKRTDRSVNIHGSVVFLSSIPKHRWHYYRLFGYQKFSFDTEQLEKPLLHIRVETSRHQLDEERVFIDEAAMLLFKTKNYPLGPLLYLYESLLFSK
jgi:hypothetical protein